MYAVIETGGKQFTVMEGDIITVEKLPVNEGDNYTFENVLAISREGAINVGAPYISGANVSARVIKNGRAEKIIIFKYKAKKGYRKKQGHRQPFTKLQIEKITG